MSLRPALLALILVAVLSNAAAQLLLRIAARGGPALSFDGRGLVALALQPAFVAGLICYAASLIVWLRVLRDVDVSLAYPFLALGFVIVAVAGVGLLGESMPPRRLVAIAVITVGVGLLARS